MLLTGRFVGAKGSQGVKGMAQGSGRQQDHSQVAPGNGIGDDLADGREVGVLGRLTHAHRDPGLLALQERQEVGRGVGDRQMLVVDGGDPALGTLIGHASDQFGEGGIARYVERHARHTPGQLVGREETLSTLVRGDDELDRGEPVAVDDDHQIRLEGVEHVALEVEQSGMQRALLAVVEREALLVGQHDCGNVCEHGRANYFTHGSFPLSLDTS